eukprot:gene1555-3006_t
MMYICLLACLVNIALAFNHGAGRFGQQLGLSKTRVYEDFNLDFKNPVIISSPVIFSEKQLREFTATYSVDERFNPLQFLLGLLPGQGEKVAASAAIESKPQPGFAKSLKPSVSLAVLEEKTASFVKGTIKAKAYLGILQAAFGEKLPQVLPEIINNLPPAKATELSKA